MSSNDNFSDINKYEEINKVNYESNILNLLSATKTDKTSFHQHIDQAKKNVTSLFKSTSFFGVLFKVKKKSKKNRRLSSYSPRKKKNLNSSSIMNKSTIINRNRAKIQSVESTFSINKEKKPNSKDDQDNKENQKETIINPIKVPIGQKKLNKNKEDKKEDKNNYYAKNKKNINANEEEKNNIINKNNRNNKCSLPQIKITNSYVKNDKNKNKNFNSNIITNFNSNPISSSPSVPNFTIENTLFSLTSKREISNKDKCKLKKINIKDIKNKNLLTNNENMQTNKEISSQDNNKLKVKSSHTKNQNINPLTQMLNTNNTNDDKTLFKSFSTNGITFTQSNADRLNSIINLCKYEIYKGNLVNRIMCVHNKEIDHRFDKVNESKRKSNENEDIEFLKKEKKHQNKYEVLKNEIIEKSKGKLNIKVSDELVYKNKKVFEKFINNGSNKDPYELYGEDLEKIENKNKLLRIKENKEYEEIEKILNISNKHKENLKNKIDINLIKFKLESENDSNYDKNNKRKKYKDKFFYGDEDYLEDNIRIDKKYTQNLGVKTLARITSKKVKIVNN